MCVTFFALSAYKVLPDKDGKRCMFCLKTLTKTYELSASDTKQRQEWTTGLCAMFILASWMKGVCVGDLKIVISLAYFFTSRGTQGNCLII